MRVLVLRALGLGDLLTAVPALRGLRNTFRSAHLQLACPAALAPLARLTEAVDEVVDVGPLQPLPAAGAGVDVHGAELAVNLHGRGPQSTALLRATRPRRLLAWGVDGRQWRPDEHEVHRWCRLLAESGIEADPNDLDVTGPALASPVPGATLIHPGAGRPTRRWPVERWAAVARALQSTGHQVVVTAGPGEGDLAAAVAARAPGAQVVAPSGVLQLAAVVASARLLVSPDTGVAHLATALRTPSVVLFGPTPPQLWGPPANRPQHRALWAGRQGDDAAPDIDPGLLRLTIDDVLAALA